MPNDTITVYHGTNLFSAQLIHIYGIRLDAQRRFSDFGKGFYVTFNSKQAIRWSIVRANNLQVSPKILEKLNISQDTYLNHYNNKIPVLLSFELDVQKLLTLNGKIFPFPNYPNWKNYYHLWKQFVYKCRAGEPHPFDFVYGPIGGGHFKHHKKIKVSMSKEQLALNSTKAIGCLTNMRIFPFSPYRIPVKADKNNLLLGEVQEIITREYGITNEHADSLIRNSWVSGLHRDILLHESPHYWALSLIGGSRLWVQEYEDKLLMGN
ncbi:DUF3990 domain-containing protein [Bacillus sp. EB600]|uniref:DUF3990 domain-containing protein n=1 Tax=Bacillus sp. EB600 TaxID=2806345 RepID=UPI00210D674B|nr:DUF3990 domain-containing protein [Bacillus sp. EB600]MCQ6279973.1 DUF3990 domain-containing protein [Bacillus sp. EB600]